MASPVVTIKIAKGTKEIIPVTVVDRTEQTTDLSTASPKFWFQKPDTTYVYNNVATTAVGMTINPLVDASSTGPSGELPVGTYKLWVSWTVGSEIPKRLAAYVVISED